ncbi:MAG: hypothetical protein KC910_11825 [Candidatus Eremiobacteraeota bacterium]|nr:hypothetical protein [Candidatus Eremiobacteraeota bacterium]
MQVLSTGRQAVERALSYLAEARGYNDRTTEESARANQAVDGFGPALKAIEFDRNDRDFSQQGRLIRSIAHGAADRGEVAAAAQARSETLLAQLEEAVEEALAATQDNSRVQSRLLSARHDILFAIDNANTIEVCLHHGTSALSEGLEPYLVEVEEDAPGRDVGRFAHSIEELLLDGKSRLGTSEIYAKSVTRSLLSAERYLVAARDAL